MHTYNPNIGCVVRLEGWNSNENEAKKEKKRKKLRRRRGLEPVGAREKKRELCQATTGSLAEFPNLHLWSKLFKSVTHYRNSWLKMAPNFCSFEKKSSCPKEIVVLLWREALRVHHEGTNLGPRNSMGMLWALNLVILGTQVERPGSARRDQFLRHHVACSSNPLPIFLLFWEKRFFEVENTDQAVVLLARVPNRRHLRKAEKLSFHVMWKYLHYC